MHANRTARRANTTRRKLAAARQAPLPLDEQRRRAAENQAHKEAKWARAGYLAITYDDRANEFKPRKSRQVAEPDNVFGDLVELSILTLALNRHGRRRDQRRGRRVA